MSDEFYCDDCEGWVDHLPHTDECPNHKKQPSLADRLAAVTNELEKAKTSISNTTAKLNNMLDDMLLIASLHENHENDAVGYRSTLLYSARCIARSSIAQAKKENNES